MGVSDYINMIKGNSELGVKKEMKNMKFVCRYKTNDELILSEVSGKVLKKQAYQELSKKYSDMVYFNFLIELEKSGEAIGEKGDESYFKMLDYFSNQMQNDFFAVVNGDTIPCAIYHYERNFELSPYNNINLAFSSALIRKKITNEWLADVSIIYDDRILGTGPLQFNFSKNNINELPVLDYEKN
jgi:hypothetical protein